MEGPAGFYVVALNVDQLRKGLMTERDRARRYQQTAIASIRLRLRLANGLRRLATYVEPNASAWSPTSPRHPASVP